MRELYNRYLNNDLCLEKSTKIGIVCLIIVITGIFGWFYEFIFYYFNSGMTTFYYRGANFFPWINIYASGSLMILFLTRKCKKNPLCVFLISFLSTGVLEYISGYGMLKFAHMRCWDYNTEILNIGNIDGFVCLRSVTFFGLSALLLVYFITPLCIYLSQKMNKNLFFTISVIICFVILFDELYNLVFARLLDLPRAYDVYKKIGFKYMDYYKNS